MSISVCSSDRLSCFNEVKGVPGPIILRKLSSWKSNIIMNVSIPCPAGMDQLNVRRCLGNALQLACIFLCYVNGNQ